jgi:hypothetical protein
VRAPVLSRVEGLVVLVALLISCGGPARRPKKGTAGGDETAAEYQRRKAREAGELDASSAGKWGAWKYEGERDDCRYVLGRRCFTKRENACKAAKCKTECLVRGGGPAMVSCAKTKS